MADNTDWSQPIGRLGCQPSGLSIGFRQFCPGEQCELGGASGQSSGFCQIVKLSTHLTITRTGDPEISLSSTTRLVWPIFLEHSLDNESIDRMVAQTLVTCRSRS